MSAFQTLKSGSVWRARVRSFFSVITISAIFLALIFVADNITSHNFVTNEDHAIAAGAYMVYAAWIGVIFQALFCWSLGPKFFKSQFKGFSLPRKVHLLTFAAGSLAAVATYFNLWASQLKDVGGLIVIANLVIVYTTIFEIVAKKVKFKQVVLPMMLVVLGGAAASYGGKLPENVKVFVLLGVVSCFFGAGMELFGGEAVNEKNGGEVTSVIFWRFFWQAFTATVTILVVSYFGGKLPLLLSIMGNSWKYIPMFVLTMFFVTMGIGFKLRAINEEGNVSVVLIGISIQIVIGFVITYLGDKLIPGIFGTLPKEPITWIIRIIGALILLPGVWILKKNQKRVQEIRATVS